MCQIDDFVVAVAVAVLQDAGKRVEVYSQDGRFQLSTLQLPRIRYPFFMVVQTHDSTVGVPVYQKDSSVLNTAIHGRVPNPDYIAPIWTLEHRYGTGAWTRSGKSKIATPGVGVPGLSIALET